MSNTQLYIPDKCKVGFQSRQGTYTGKLGYIIYHDGKVWRKEPSWEGWRHKEGQKWSEWDAIKQERIESTLTGIEPIEFENIPTEGFVLNKKAGGYSSGWNHRQTYCRVYDPRGWEFEITIPNLLYILQECSAYKGKGLEGEFVYSWEGKDLVLLPVSSPDYKECKKFTDLQSQKIGKKDLVEGCSYLTSKMEKLIYLGQHNVIESTWDNRTEIEGRGGALVKKHVFKKSEENEHYSYEFLTSFSRLKQKISDEIDPNFADYIDELQKSEYYSLASHLIVEKITKEAGKNIFDRYWNQTIYKFGEIRTKEDLLSLTRQIHKSNTDKDKWDVSVITKVPGTNYWNRGTLYDTYIPEGTFTKDEVKENYGILVRVYNNGFKKAV